MFFQNPSQTQANTTEREAARKTHMPLPLLARHGVCLSAAGVLSVSANVLHMQGLWQAQGTPEQSSGAGG